VPLSVKDLVNTKGVRTTFASLIFAENVAADDSVCVARLKRAGAILIGKTTTPEFGHKPLTEAPLFGRTRNAWDDARTSGGSSGGAAVSVAAGIAPLAVATDAGGSTRIPAACNGVVGFKQSLGCVPHDMAPDGFSNLSYITPTTRTVMDTALMLDAMAGPHFSDPHSVNFQKQDFSAAARGEGSLAGLRIAWRPFLGNTAIDSEVLRICEQAIGVFTDLQGRVEQVDDDFEPAEPIWQVIMNSLWHARYGDYLRNHRDQMSSTLVGSMDRGAHHTAEQLQKANFARTAIYRQVEGWFDQVDVIITPTLTRTALPIEHDYFGPITIEGREIDTVRKAWYPYTHPFNLTGHPAVTIPCGWASDGLPVGLQLVGRWAADALLLRVAALFEKARPWAQRRPCLPALDEVLGAP
jgi:aspartyl-tRNA(Asn)/glutamyl-tRNA(Gln) amidotransferase subunit A